MQFPRPAVFLALRACCIGLSFTSVSLVSADSLIPSVGTLIDSLFGEPQRIPKSAFGPPFDKGVIVYIRATKTTTFLTSIVIGIVIKSIIMYPKFNNVGPAAFLVSALTLTQVVTATPFSPPRQKNIGTSDDSAAAASSSQAASNQERRDAVKQAFQISWDGYYKYAFPHDSLRPVTNSYEDDRNGWGASAIDAFSTAIVMRNWPVINQILAYVPQIDFTRTSSEISLFETTIRYLGGLLSAYDLLTTPSLYADAKAAGPDVHLNATSSQTATDAILAQAIRLADALSVAFDTPSGIPDNNLIFDPATGPKRTGSQTNGIATIGTLVLEWTRLSDITGNSTYAQLAQRAEAFLLNPQPPQIAEPFPGLLGTNVNITSGLFVDSTGGWGGGTDSFYEYLIKMYLYDPDRFALYRDRWILAADSSIQYVASHPTTRPDLTFLGGWKGPRGNTTLRFSSGHLDCFDGGNFILGGLTLSNKKYLDFGLELVKSCAETYSATATGIGPELFSWQDNRTPLNATNNRGPPSAEQKAFYEKNGFWITNEQYVLRPEVIESMYYAWRATKDEKYREWAWAAFKAINVTTRAGSGYSSVANVNKVGGGSKTDFQESFWFAEVLKYCWLIFQDEDDPWQVKADQTNEFVYNTECHPIRLAKGHETQPSSSSSPSSDWGYGSADEKKNNEQQPRGRPGVWKHGDDGSWSNRREKRFAGPRYA
ncbi:mannosyl-oligosaccharide alpha-1,2-mannosidase precursor [Neurospora crassa]|nr:mannosyl-oligosaccharide alpha-1,2-mannosidase precursor [Neurospora crassa]